MATPRRRIRIRDKEATMKQFLNAIGSILRKEGFSGLKVNKIARHCGKDKTLISRYFKDLAGLQRAYITEKDYWIPIFERFVLTEVDGVAQIKETFVALMQENFEFFCSNAEMQNIILWQISEANPLMTEISMSREAHGEELFKFTEPLFKNSAINFRAIIGLLLGGVYYMVLHARTNKSKVCGIDINIESDKIEILKAIEQIITWSCERADPTEKQNQTINMMNYQYELLETFATQLSARRDHAVTETPDPMMVTETKKLNRTIPHHVLNLTNETQIASYMKMSLTKLTEACDLLYIPERKFNPDADLIVDLICSLIKMFADMVPGMVVLPQLFCKRESVIFYSKWQIIKQNLEQLKINPFLIDIIYIPFKKFSLLGPEAVWYDYQYLKVYASILEAETSEELADEDALLDLLIGLGFNHSRLTAHYTNKLKKSYEGQSDNFINNLLMEAQTAVGQMNSRTSLSFDTGKSTIVEELNRWIEMELNRKKWIVDLKEPVDFNPLSLNTNLNAGQLSFWQKLQYDHGIYDEPTLDVFSEKVSNNFKTRGGTRPSAASVKSKLYPKIEITYKPLEEKLEKMLEEVKRYGN